MSNYYIHIEARQAAEEALALDFHAARAKAIVEVVLGSYFAYLEERDRKRRCRELLRDYTQ